VIIHDVEQNTPAWEKIRAGKPTASNFSKLITSTGAVSKTLGKYAIKLAGEKFAGKPLDGWKGNQYTERGHEIEEEGVLAYEMQMEVDTEKVGFCTDDLLQYGCSPDRFVVPSDELSKPAKGLLEMKCLPEAHIEALLYYRKNAKIPTSYVAQVQGQLLVTGFDYCDLMFYQPDLPHLIVRCMPDAVIQSALVAQIRAVIAERNIVLDQLKTF